MCASAAYAQILSSDRSRTMVMISKETLDKYYYRTFKLRRSFRDNLKRAEAEMVVEDSPVDYATHQFICSIHDCYSTTLRLRLIFALTKLPGDVDAVLRDEEDIRKWVKDGIKDLHSLEERLASQNKFFEKRVSTQTVKS